MIILEFFKTLFTGSSGAARADFESINNVSMALIERIQQRLDKVEQLEEECRKERDLLREELLKLRARVEQLEKKPILPPFKGYSSK